MPPSKDGAARCAVTAAAGQRDKNLFKVFLELHKYLLEMGC